MHEATNAPAGTLDEITIDPHLHSNDWHSEVIKRWAALLDDLHGAAGSRPDTSAPAR
jgi:hypothetical protein